VGLTRLIRLDRDPLTNIRAVRAPRLKMPDMAAATYKKDGGPPFPPSSRAVLFFSPPFFSFFQKGHQKNEIR
jgi:hypothetical protein